MELRKRLEKRLLSGKFRMINEKLYKTPGLKINEDLIPVYHEGFKNQKQKWTEKPIEKVKERIAECNGVIVDVGSGEEEIAKSFPFVVSVDIHPQGRETIKAEMCKLPLKNSFADVVVFCMSLMMKNVAKAVAEGRRILKRSGRLILVESASRTTDAQKFLRKIEELGLEKTFEKIDRYTILAEFKKTEKKREKLPEIILKPCLYKKR